MVSTMIDRVRGEKPDFHVGLTIPGYGGEARGEVRFRPKRQPQEGVKLGVLILTLQQQVALGKDTESTGRPPPLSFQERKE